MGADGTCPKNPAIRGPHNLQSNSHGYQVCRYGCGFKMRTPKPQTRNVVEIVGNGNKKADRANADKLRRHNSEQSPRSHRQNHGQSNVGRSRANPEGVPAGSEGCAFIGIGLIGGVLGGAAALIYAATEVVSNFI